MSPTRQMTRRELYDLLWRSPLPEVADELGLSSITLEALCTAHRVPRPASTYWKNKAAGKPVKEVRFVSTANPADELIVISQTRPAPQATPTARKPEVSPPPPRSEKHKEPLPRPPVEKPHPLIAPTARELRRKAGSRDKGLFIHVYGERIWGLNIGRDSVERAIWLLDTAVKALAGAGFEIELSQNGLEIRSKGEKAFLQLKEKSNRIPHVLTQEESDRELRARIEARKRGEEYSSLSYYYPSYDYLPSGLMTITLSSTGHWTPEHTWKDGKRTTVEDRIEELPSVVSDLIERLIEQRRNRERMERNSQRRSRREYRQRQRNERNAERRKVLDDLVAVTTEADRLRAWLKDVDGWPEAPDAIEFNRFVEWSRMRLADLADVVTPQGISKYLRERKLFPDVDPLLDPPEDLIEE